MHSMLYNDTYLLQVSKWFRATCIRLGGCSNPCPKTMYTFILRGEQLLRIIMIWRWWWWSNTQRNIFSFGYTRKLRFYVLSFLIKEVSLKCKVSVFCDKKHPILFSNSLKFLSWYPFRIKCQVYCMTSIVSLYI